MWSFSCTWLSKLSECLLLLNITISLNMNKIIKAKLFWIHFSLQNLKNVCDQIVAHQLLRTVHTQHSSICFKAFFSLPLFWLNCFFETHLLWYIGSFCQLPLLLKWKKTFTMSLPVWLLKHMKAISNSTLWFRY